MREKFTPNCLMIPYFNISTRPHNAIHIMFLGKYIR